MAAYGSQREYSKKQTVEDTNLLSPDLDTDTNSHLPHSMVSYHYDCPESK